MEQKKNREWVKNAAIIFLAVLLVLTFFSNTIMNRSLPEVATQNVTSGSIVARVRGTGVVTAVGASQVKADKNREIRSVLVKVGQKVEPGDVLFTLGAGTTEEIEAAEEKVRTLQTNYNRTAASAPIFDYTTDWRRMQNLEKARDEAKAKMDEIAAELEGTFSTINSDIYKESSDVNSENVKTNQARLDAVNAKIAAAQLLVQKTKDLLDTQLTDKEEAFKITSNYNAQKERETELAAQLESVNNEQQKYTEYTNLVAELTETEASIKSTKQKIEEYDAKRMEEETALRTQSAALSAELSILEQQKSTLEIQTIGAESQITILNNDIKTLNEEISRLKEQGDNITAEQKENEVKLKQEEITLLEGKLSDLAAIKEKINNKESEKTSVDNSIKNDTGKSDLQETLDNLTDKSSQIQTDISTKYSTVPTDQTENIATIESQLAAIKELLEQGSSDSLLQDAIDALVAVSKEDYDKAVAELDAALLEKEVLLEKIDRAKSTQYQAAKKEYEAAEDAYKTAQENLAFNMAHDAQTASVTGVDLASLNEQLEIAKKKLAELTGEDQQITAKVSGIIQTIDTTAGSVVKKDDILCTIEVPDMGYTMSFSVTNDQANRVRPGDTATVSNFYWGNEVTATLNNIKVDPKNPQNKLLTFDLDGNVTAGSQLTISVGQKSANYDIIIPSSAIRTDANGSFVLRVDAKNSPLGNRYIARRVQVEVLASDDSNSAVTGDLNNGDYVITTSTSPIKSGQLVRLANY